MWSSILGALAISGMVMFAVAILPNASKLIDAFADRLRYGAQRPSETASLEPVTTAKPMPERHTTQTARPAKAA